MTYAKLQEILNQNHIYPKLEETIHLKGKSVTGLIVDCPAIILMDDKVARIKQILEAEGAKYFEVYGLSNNGEIIITRK